MTQLPKDTVLRLAKDAGAVITEGSASGVQIYAFLPNELHEFAALIQAELEKPQGDILDAMYENEFPSNSKHVWLRDLDGTGSLHVCLQSDPGAIEFVGKL